MRCGRRSGREIVSERQTAEDRQNPNAELIKRTRIDKLQCWCSTLWSWSFHNVVSQKPILLLKMKTNERSPLSRMFYSDHVNIVFLCTVANVHSPVKWLMFNVHCEFNGVNYSAPSKHYAAYDVRCGNYDNYSIRHLWWNSEAKSYEVSSNNTTND